MKTEPTILAIETSAAWASVALAQGTRLLAEEPFDVQLRHAGQLLPAIEQLLRRHDSLPGDLDQLYLSIGPGSFTGLRLAVTAAKALAFALPQLRLVAVPTTDVLALNGLHAAQTLNLPLEHLAVVIDAQQGMIYGACYHRTTSAQACTQPTLVPGLEQRIAPARMHPETLLAQTPRPLYILGEALPQHAQALSGPDLIPLTDEYARPHAANVHRCGYLRAQAGCFTDPYALEPLYLRRPEAVVRWEQRHAQETP